VSVTATTDRKEYEMADLYTYRVDIFTAEPIDLTGFDVEATDGHIGNVDEATVEASGSCLVVDTGFWIFGKKRMIPAGVVNKVDVENKKVFVSMTKQEIKDAPDFDQERHASDARAHHSEQEGYYRPYGI
jgi:hypothetical protein